MGLDKAGHKGFGKVYIPVSHLVTSDDQTPLMSLGFGLTAMFWVENEPI